MSRTLFLSVRIKFFNILMRYINKETLLVLVLFLKILVDFDHETLSKTVINWKQDLILRINVLEIIKTVFCDRLKLNYATSPSLRKEKKNP